MISHTRRSNTWATSSLEVPCPGWEREVAPISGKTAFIVVHNAVESVPLRNPLCRRPRFEKPALSCNTTSRRCEPTACIAITAKFLARHCEPAPLLFQLVRQRASADYVTKVSACDMEIFLYKAWQNRERRERYIYLSTTRFASLVPNPLAPNGYLKCQTLWEKLITERLRKLPRAFMRNI